MCAWFKNRNTLYHNSITEKGYIHSKLWYIKIHGCEIKRKQHTHMLTHACAHITYDSIVLKAKGAVRYLRNYA